MRSASSIRSGGCGAGSWGSLSTSANCVAQTDLNGLLAIYAHDADVAPVKPCLCAFLRINFIHTSFKLLKYNTNFGTSLTTLSPYDKYPLPDDDPSLENLLFLDGEIMEVGDGYWVKISAKVVKSTAGKPHGVDYALSLFDPDDHRVLGYDNAHPVPVGRSPAKRMSETNDHKHAGERVTPYSYVNAETLLVDFWTDVERVLKEKGIP